MLTEAQEIIRYKATLSLGDMVYKLASMDQELMDEDPELKILTRAQKDLYDRIVIVRFFLKTLQYHSYLNAVQIARIIEAIKVAGNINMYPAAEILDVPEEPVIIASGQGEQGNAGQDGEDGSDATVDVVPAAGEAKLDVVETVVSGIKTFELTITTYEPPTLSIVSESGYVFEEGSLQSVTIEVDTVVGSLDILSRDIIDPLGVDLLSLSGTEQFTVNNIEEDTTFTLEVVDEEKTLEESIEVTFVYPFLFGYNESALSTGSLYTALDKVIETFSDKAVELNGDYGYFYFMYPESYGSLTSIKDNNGIEVIDAFTESSVSITSSGLNTNWTNDYLLYRTTDITTINNKTYQFIF